MTARSFVDELCAYSPYVEAAKSVQLHECHVIDLQSELVPRLTELDG